MNLLAAMIINLHFVLIFTACVCLVLLILNIGTRVNLLALALLLFFVSLLTGCATTPEQITAYSEAAHTVVHNGAQDYKDVVYATHQH